MEGSHVLPVGYDPDDEWQTECPHGVTFADDTPLAAAIAAEIGCRRRCEPGDRLDPDTLEARLDRITPAVVTVFHGWTR